MGGPTITVAPALSSSSSSKFTKSHSSPHLLSLASPTFSSTKRRPVVDNELSFTPPTFDVPSFDSDFQLDISLFSPSIQVPSIQVPSKPAPPLDTEESPEPQHKLVTNVSRTASLIDRRRSWVSNRKHAKEASAEERQSQRPATAQHYAVGGSIEAPTLRPLTRSLTSSGSFASFARRSWMSSSRSPSPSPSSRPESPVEEVASSRYETTTSHKLKRGRTPKAPDSPPNKADEKRPPSSLVPAPTAFTRASNYLSKIKQSQTINLSKSNVYPVSNDSQTSSAVSLAHPPSNSTDTSISQSVCSDGTTPIPTDDSSNESAPYVRDPLWSSFRNLDTEFKGFVSKQTGHRIVQVQSLVLPFLRTTMNHASTKSLRPEDVDRRATILNKWWITILDMLDGHGGQQPVPGVDRPILLEAAAMIMMRAEWRQTTSCFQPLADRSPTERVRTRSWTGASTSTRSSQHSAMLAESAEHNVRTMFIANLVKQMAFVVDRMSMRHAPLTLVNFAGKTCAYAFFFAPGVAEVIVRLWGLTPELIRRASDELGLPRRDNGESEDITALFPPKLSTFGWTSPRKTWDYLKQIPRLTMLVSRIPWTGPWIGRWKGHDTDLFFIFCKYFHILSDQFIPAGLPLTEKARSPGFALVQAQLLSIMDTTIHRQTAIGGMYSSPLADAANVNASALSMPMPPTNLLKDMSENRLVILLRDFLSDDSAEAAGARHTFAEAFASMMKVATQRTSQFNNAACFTLCDFLEEVITIYNEFEAPDGSFSYIDWDFWIEVCKRILNSMNTMSEVRLLCFIFTIWDAAAKDPRTKEAMCLDWLLTEETFNALFNNWCPMVRAYYHRLLCWRICRDEGSPNEIDSSIFLTVAARLKTTWTHYLYLRDAAFYSGRLPPSTAPMPPTLGKKFMIIRQEVNVPQPGLFMGFDSFARAPSSNSASVPPSFENSGTLPKGPDGKKRWSLLGKVLSLTSGANGALVAEGYGRKPSADERLQTARHEVERSRSGAPLPPPKTLREDSSMNLRDIDFESPPIFEEPKYTFRFFLGWQQPAMPPRERILTRPRLPGPAESRVRVRVRSRSPGLPRAGRPEVTRSVSGCPHVGLIHAARNASPLSSADSYDEGSERSPSLALSSAASDNFETPHWDDDPWDYFSKPVRAESSISLASSSGNSELVMESTMQPVKPEGVYAKTAVYSGRAQAEWAQVVSEYNVFVDRRRDEGVMGLSEVEVPLLGVEGFRKLGG